MVVDMPPGTGDAQLSLVQTIDLDGAVMVTTPQDVATGDVRRGIKMFERVNTPVLGVVENMAGWVCPHCGEEADVFGRGGGERLAQEMKVPFLGRVPLDATVVTAGDRGASHSAGGSGESGGPSARGAGERAARATGGGGRPAVRPPPLSPRRGRRRCSPPRFTFWSGTIPKPWRCCVRAEWTRGCTGPERRASWSAAARSCRR